MSTWYIIGAILGTLVGLAIVVLNAIFWILAIVGLIWLIVAGGVAFWRFLERKDPVG